MFVIVKMPRLVNCIKNCCYTLLLVAFVCAVSSLFVWQAEVYQQTIDEQVNIHTLFCIYLFKSTIFFNILTRYTVISFVTLGLFRVR